MNYCLPGLPSTWLLVVYWWSTNFPSPNMWPLRFDFSSSVCGHEAGQGANTLTQVGKHAAHSVHSPNHNHNPISHSFNHIINNKVSYTLQRRTHHPFHLHKYKYIPGLFSGQRIRHSYHNILSLSLSLSGSSRPPSGSRLSLSTTYLYL